MRDLLAFAALSSAWVCGMSQTWVFWLSGFLGVAFVVVWIYLGERDTDP